MPTFANITPNAASDGILYSDSATLTSTEADLFNGSTAIDAVDPIPVLYGQSLQAVVKLTVTGNPAGNSTYVVLQTDLGDGTWIDVAWCFWNGTQGMATFVLSAGGVGEINNAFQQVRQSGSVPNPQANGTNEMILGGRCRFVGRTSLSGGSSAVGGFAGVRATIRYKLYG